LACLRLDPPPPRHMSGHQTVDSDGLIADLEYQLGDVRTEYLKVHLSYCHSGFPAYSSASLLDGISACQTRLETVASGVIKRHTPASAWSPYPIPSPVSNTLFAIIASHWGPIRANEIMLRIITSRSTPRKVATSRQHATGSEETVRLPERTATAPPLRVPRRQASLSKPLPGQDDDPARKIWTQIRRTSSNNRPGYVVSRVNRVPASVTDSSLPKAGKASSRKGVDRQREIIREMAIQNQRSLGTESLRSLVPSPVYTEDLGSNGIQETTLPTGSGDELQSSRNRRDGRWSLGNWW
jgi:hypothetical protein